VSILHRTCEHDAIVRVWPHLGNPIHAAYTFYQQSLMIRASYWFSLGLEIMPRPWIFYLLQFKARKIKGGYKALP